MPVYRTPAAVDAYSRLAPAPTRVLLATETGQPRAPEQARLYCLTHRFVDWKQARTMRWEDKENASPQMSHAADSPGPAKALLAQNTAKTPQGAGVKNRFGYTPSPGTQTAPLGSAERVPEAAPKAQAFTLDLSAATAPSAKQIISEMSESARSARQDNGGGVAMTISWTPQKVVKKPVLKGESLWLAFASRRRVQPRPGPLPIVNHRSVPTTPSSRRLPLRRLFQKNGRWASLLPSSRLSER